MDFVKIRYKFKNGIKIYYPDFLVNPAWTDLMVRGCSFYAIWDERKGLWSTSEYDVARLVDREIRKAIDEDPAKDCEGELHGCVSRRVWFKCLVGVEKIFQIPSGQME